MRSTVAGILLVAAIGCAKRDQASTDSAAGAAAPAAAPAAGASTSSSGSMAMIDVAKLPGGGEYLTDTEGRAVYIFEKDKADSSSCSAECAAAWPPVTSNGAPMAHNDAIDATKLRTMTRADGRVQVTYDHKPLYYFAQDHARGEIKGQDAKDFGGEWYLVKPSGGKQDAKK